MENLHCFHLHRALSISFAKSAETDQPVELSCSYTLCGDCPVQQVNSENCQCHITSCKSKFTVGGIKKPSEQLMASLGALQYKCTNGSCTTTVPLQRLQTYLNQPVHKSTCSLPKAHTSSHFTLLQVLDAPTNSTPSTVEHRVLCHLAHRMMTSSCVHSTDTLSQCHSANRSGMLQEQTQTKLSQKSVWGQK